jgi:hypothetical protein
MSSTSTTRNDTSAFTTKISRFNATANLSRSHTSATMDEILTVSSRMLVDHHSSQVAPRVICVVSEQDAQPPLTQNSTSTNSSNSSPNNTHQIDKAHLRPRILVLPLVSVTDPRRAFFRAPIRAPGDRVCSPRALSYTRYCFWCADSYLISTIIY